MEWIAFRSRRDRAVWLPWALALGGTLVLAFAGHAWVDAWAAELGALAERDPDAAAARAVPVLRAGAWVSASLLGGLAIGLLHYFRAARRARRLPAPGRWSHGSFRYLEGDDAVRAARLGEAVTWALFPLALGFALAVERLLHVLGG